MWLKHHSLANSALQWVVLGIWYSTDSLFLFYFIIVISLSSLLGTTTIYRKNLAMKTLKNRIWKKKPHIPAAPRTAQNGTRLKIHFGNMSLSTNQIQLPIVHVRNQKGFFTMEKTKSTGKNNTPFKTFWYLTFNKSKHFSNDCYIEPSKRVLFQFLLCKLHSEWVFFNYQGLIYIRSIW